MTIAERVRASRKAAGLDTPISDPQALAKIAALLTNSPACESGETVRRRALKGHPNGNNSSGG